MKNLSLLFNAILAIAVAYLYFLHFGSKKTAELPVIAPATSATSSLKVAYVNIDTLYEKYEWFKQQKAALEKKLTNADNSLSSRENAFMQKVQQFQQKVESGNVAAVELQKEQEQLSSEEQSLQKERMRLAKNLEEETKGANEQLQKSLEEKLKHLRSQIGYDYVMGYQKGMPNILLANDSLDITRQVLQLLNAATDETKK